MKSKTYLQANLHEAIHKVLKYNMPVYLTILGGISFESGDYKIEKTNEGIIITENGKEVFSEVSQLYRNAGVQDVHEDSTNERPDVADHKGKSDKGATARSVGKHTE
jgi:hypothetical protein